MGYIERDAHDVFVSYAHGPVPLGPLAGGRIDPLGKWTRALVANVGEQVDFYLGIKNPAERAHLWMDPELEGNLPLTANLRAKVEQSALMLLVMSPFYLQSDWCGDEVGWFTAANPDHGAEGDVFVVRVVPTDEEKWPSTLRDEQGATLPGYRFHPAMRPGEMCEPLGWPEPTADDSQYMDLVGQLARDIAKRLTKLRWAREHAPKGAPVAVPESVGRRVFLGYMHDTLSQGEEDIPAALRAAFAAAGITMLPPAESTPTDEDGLRQALATYLPQSEACVLVANQFMSPWPAGQPGGFLSFQLEEARAKHVPSYLWLRVPDPGRIKLQSYRTYLEELRGQADAKGLSLSHDDLEAFVASVVSRLDQATSPEAGIERLAVVCANGRGQVAEWDSFLAQIVRILDDKELPSWIAPIDQETGQIRLEELNQTLDLADTILIVCFDQNFQWAHRLWSQIKSRALMRNPDAKRIFVLGPRDLQKGMFNLPKFTSLVAPDAARLDPLSAQL